MRVPRSAPPPPTPHWRVLGEATHPTKRHRGHPCTGVLVQSVHTGRYLLYWLDRYVSVPQTWAKHEAARQEATHAPG